MKNFKMNEQLRTRIGLGGLGLALLISGYEVGKFDSKKNNSSDSENTATVCTDESVNMSSDEFVAQYLDNYNKVSPLQSRRGIYKELQRQI